ncbi:MAG: DPP IV N-terminal domain-containing protein [Gemmatimonadota bacterium]
MKSEREAMRNSTQQRVRANPERARPGSPGVHRLLRALLAAWILVPALPVPWGRGDVPPGTRAVWAQEAPPAARAAAGEFTLERIHGTAAFQPAEVSVTWLADGRHWATLDEDARGRPELWRVDAVTGRRERWIGAEELRPQGSVKPIRVESFSLSADESRVLLFANAQRVWRQRTKGEYYVFDFASRTLTPVSRAPGWQMFAKFSPDASRVAFVRDHDLFVTDLGTGEEHRLTSSGSETIINGTTDWVYEEELGLRDAFRWSPDGRRIAYWQFDQSPIPEFDLIDQTKLYPEITPVRYPKAGQPNSKVRVGSIDLETGRTTWFDTGSDPESYLARMDWAASSEEVSIQRLNRHQNRLDLLLGDSRTGRTRTVLTETDAAWVDLMDPLVWLDGGSRFVWTSERDGWRHLYLYGRDGRLIRQLTRGEWEVTELNGVDEASGRVFFTAALESPLTRQLLSVSLKGGEPKELVGGRGSHSGQFGPDFGYFLDTHSTIDTPPTTILYRVKGSDAETVRVVEDNHALAARLDSLGLGSVEFTRVRAADGTPLNSFLIKPRDFDPNRRYGLLMYVYGGPGSQTVIDRWGGSRYLWHQYLARHGVLVASVDNRGTGARGRQFKKQTYLKLGQLETADQLAALSQLGALPFVDAHRVGIWGWSYGGYMALLTTLESGGRVAAGISVAPVTYWGLYDTIYTERYMRTPDENLEGYRKGSPLTHAAELESPLLIVHGTGDDNVHFQNTLLMVQALEEANKQFDVRFYPNKRHGIAGPVTRVNLFRLLTDFALGRLGGADAVTARAAGAR